MIDKLYFKPVIVADNRQFFVDTLKVLGKNIKHYRSQLGLTQEELATLSGVYRSHLAGIETGSLNPSVKTVEKLAKALDVSVADLFRQEVG